MKVALIHLSGQGDVDYKLVSLDTYNWILSKDTPPPESQIAAAMNNSSLWEEKDEPMTRAAAILYLSRWDGSSPDNDRALIAEPEFAPGVIFWTLKEVLKYASEHDLEIDETYDGWIY